MAKKLVNTTRLVAIRQTVRTARVMQKKKRENKKGGDIMRITATHPLPNKADILCPFWKVRYIKGILANNGYVNIKAKPDLRAYKKY